MQHKRQGQSETANTYFWIDPTRRNAGVIMMQIWPFVDAKALALFDAYEKNVYASACLSAVFK